MVAIWPILQCLLSQFLKTTQKNVILGCGFEAKRWWIELFFNPEKVAWKLRMFYTTWKYFILTMRKTGAEAGDFADAAGDFVATKIKKMVAGGPPAPRCVTPVGVDPARQRPAPSLPLSLV